MQTMTTRTIGWMAALSLAMPVLAHAAEPENQPEGPPLIAHEALQKRLNDPNLRLLDVRPRAEYEKGHIPGALWVDNKALGELARGDSFADKDAQRKACRALWASDRTRRFMSTTPTASTTPGASGGCSGTPGCRASGWSTAVSRSGSATDGRYRRRRRRSRPASSP